jgi:hypothetical protein
MRREGFTALCNAQWPNGVNHGQKVQTFQMKHGSTVNKSKTYFGNILEQFGTFWNILEHFGTFWNILEHFVTFEHFRNILDHFGLCLDYV